MEDDQLKIRESLLSIFSTHKLEEITDPVIVLKFYPDVGPEATEEVIRTKKESLAKVDFYLGLKTQLEDFLYAIETECGKTDAENGNPIVLEPEQQVKTVLYDVVLNRVISFAYEKDPITYKYKMRLLYDLIRQKFIVSNQWDQRLAKHFEFVYPILNDWYSFFFSYTNKMAFDINKRLEATLSLSSISSEKNQVARFVAERLSHESLPKAFIDEKEIDYGKEFVETINKALTTSYAFVQLISDESFKKIGAKNWCQYEYDKYKEFLAENKTKHSFYYENALKDNFFFLVIGQDLKNVKPPILLSEYQKWFQDISSHNYKKFYSDNSNPHSNAFDAFREAIKDLATSIVQSQKQLIDSIP